MNDPMTMFARLVVWTAVAALALMFSYSATHRERAARNVIPNPIQQIQQDDRPTKEHLALPFGSKP